MSETKCQHGKFNCDICKWINGYHISHKFPEYSCNNETNSRAKTKTLSKSNKGKK